MTKQMEEDERCLDCEEYIKNNDLSHGGSPLESYMEDGYHLCRKKNPRVTTELKTSEG